METVLTKKLTNHTGCSFFSKRSVLAHLVLTTSYDAQMSWSGLDRELGIFKNRVHKIAPEVEESCCKNVVKLTINL